MTHCLNEVKSDDDIILKEGPITYEHLTLKKPGTLFFTGAAGALGWSLGMALGMKAAKPDARVITCVGDGAYMFGNPTPALYVAKAEGWPTLTMVFNNAMWGAVKRNTREVYPSGFAAKSNREPLTYFTEHLSFEKTAEVAGGYGACVERSRRSAARHRARVQGDGRREAFRDAEHRLQGPVRPAGRKPS